MLPSPSLKATQKQFSVVNAERAVGKDTTTTFRPSLFHCSTCLTKNVSNNNQQQIVIKWTNNISPATYSF